jgi:multicomponent Na+:H+ antiporter subunit E
VSRIDPSVAVIRGTAVRAVAFALAWWALAEGDLRSPWLAALGIAAATTASVALVPPSAERRLPGPIRAAAFTGFFLRRAGAGAVDVALRAVRPGPPIRPGFVDHEVRLPAGHGRMLLVAIVNLMPGTLSAELGKGRLRIHAIDTRGAVERDLREVEDRIAHVLGLPLREADASRDAVPGVNATGSAGHPRHEG